MSNINNNTPIDELAAIIVQKLIENNIEAVMVGGSVVSYYTKNEYMSKHIDFISPNSHKEITLVMKELDFNLIGKNFIHPKS